MICILANRRYQINLYPIQHNDKARHKSVTLPSTLAITGICSDSSSNPTMTSRLIAYQPSRKSNLSPLHMQPYEIKQQNNLWLNSTKTTKGNMHNADTALPPGGQWAHSVCSSALATHMPHKPVLRLRQGNCSSTAQGLATFAAVHC